MPRCRSCGAEIIWAITENGKRMPLDAKGEQRAVIIARHNSDVKIDIKQTYTPHWATCPFAAEHRKPKGKADDTKN